MVNVRSYCDKKNYQRTYQGIAQPLVNDIEYLFIFTLNHDFSLSCKQQQPDSLNMQLELYSLSRPPISVFIRKLVGKKVTRNSTLGARCKINFINVCFLLSVNRFTSRSDIKLESRSEHLDPALSSSTANPALSSSTANPALSSSTANPALSSPRPPGDLLYWPDPLNWALLMLPQDSSVNPSTLKTRSELFYRQDLLVISSTDHRSPIMSSFTVPPRPLNEPFYPSTAKPVARTFTAKASW